MLKRTLIIALLALSGRVFGRGMVVAPARMELRLAPGESRTVPLTVGNTDPVIERFRVRIFPFDLSETGDVLYENIPEPQPPPKSWIELSPEEVEVGPELSGTVQVRVTAPSAARGTIVGAILVSLPAKGRAQSGFGVTTEPRVLVPVYLTVAGTEAPAAEVASLDVSHDPAGVFHFRAVFHNTGNTLLRPAGTWVLEQPSKAGPVELLVVPFAGDPVLPGKTRKFEGEGRGNVPAGEITGLVFFEFGAGKGDFATRSALVRGVAAAPARETEHAATGTIAESPRKAGGSAAMPVRIAFTKDGIRLDAGGPVKYRSQTLADPPSLLVDLVGYRVVNPSPRTGKEIVRRLEVHEIGQKPVVTRVTVSFRRPVDAQILDREKGLFISLKRSSPAPAPVAAEPPVIAAALPPVSTPAPAAPPAAAAPAASRATTRPATPRPAAAPSTGGWVVQVGAYASAGNADEASKTIQAQGYPVSEQTIQRDGRDLRVVMAGPFADRAAALEAGRKLGGFVRKAVAKR